MSSLGVSPLLLLLEPQISLAQVPLNVHQDNPFFPVCENNFVFLLTKILF